MIQAPTIRLLEHYKLSRKAYKAGKPDKNVYVTNDHEKASEFTKKNKRTVELLLKGDVVCPYMDWDCYVPLDTPPSVLAQLAIEYEKCIKAFFDYSVIEYIKKNMGFDIDKNVEEYMTTLATMSRLVYKGSIIADRDVRICIYTDEKTKKQMPMHKISVRGIQSNIKTDYMDYGEFLNDVMKSQATVSAQMVQNYNLEALKEGDKYPIDYGVYGEEKCMNCYGCVKDNTMTPFKWKRASYFDPDLVPLIQCPSPDAILITCIKKVVPPKAQVPTDKLPPPSLDKAILALHMLSSKIFNKYDKWMRTIPILKNTFGDDAFDPWVEWCRKGQGFGGVEDCKSKWDTFSYRGSGDIGLGTLFMWAKADNPVEYEKLFPKIDTVAYGKSYAVVKSMFETVNFKVNNPVMFVEMYNNKPLMRKQSDFRVRYESLHYYQPIAGKNGQSQYKKCSFITEWFKDENQRVFDNIDFLPPPMVCGSKTFNMWRGFDVESFEITDEEKAMAGLEDILAFIKEVVCDDSQETYDYVMKWIANIFQAPGDKSKIAFVLIGNQGDGKSYYTELIANMIGETNAYITGNPENFFQRFDGDARLNKVFTVINEIKFEEMKGRADILKGLITDDYVQHEDKGVNPVSIRNHMRMMFTTNNDGALKIEEGDRRFSVLRVNSKYNNNEAYWAQRYPHKTDKNVLRAFYEHLMDVDIPEKFDWKARPKTSAYEDIKRRSISPIYMFFTYLSITQLTEHQSYTTMELLFQYNKCMSLVGIERKISVIILGREIKKIVTEFNEDGIKQGASNGSTRTTIHKARLEQSLRTHNKWFEELEGFPMGM